MTVNTRGNNAELGRRTVDAAGDFSTIRGQELFKGRFDTRGSYRRRFLIGSMKGVQRTDLLLFDSGPRRRDGRQGGQDKARFDDGGACQGTARSDGPLRRRRAVSKRRFGQAGPAIHGN